MFYRKECNHNIEVYFKNQVELEALLNLKINLPKKISRRLFNNLSKLKINLKKNSCLLDKELGEISNLIYFEK